MSNPNPLPPPISGQWKPGQSGNPAGGRKHKAYREALERNLALLGQGDAEATLNRIAAAHITRCEQGDIGAIKEFADRMDGRVPTTIGGSTEVGPIRLYWPSGDE
jgi:hypothetical protein